MSSAFDTLRSALTGDPEADPASLRTDTDRDLSIGSNVCRLRWRNQVTTAVAADADLATTCGALLDALALFESLDRDDRSVDRSGVNLLVDRPLPDSAPSETDQALRSLRDAIGQIDAKVWYREGDGWRKDTEPAPIWPRGTDRVAGWVRDLMIPRLAAAPVGLPLAFVNAIGDPSVHLYPSEIKRGAGHRWAVRIDGLEIGVLGNETGILTVGRPVQGDGHDGPQRMAFTKVFGAAEVRVTMASPATGELSLGEAAEKVQALLKVFRRVEVPGAPSAHRSHDGAPIIDEHAVEARLLKGLIAVPGLGLVRADEEVARGSQFPTLWGTHGSRARYLDALLCDDRTPVACELKVATGGQGRYYRRSLVQAVLYRHFILNADDLDPWFEAADLDRGRVRAAIVIPIPTRWTGRFERDLALLRRIGGHLSVDVHVVDDRWTPELQSEGLRASRDRVEVLSWQLADALCRRWPQLLGTMLETHGGGGQYDELQLRAVDDKSTSRRSPTPRVVLNREGSAWVFNQVGDARWTWRGIWEALAVGHDVDEAAKRLGAIAGLGNDESHQAATFAEMAARFLVRLGEPGWRWRNACPDVGDTAGWFKQLSLSMPTESPRPAPGSLPPATRFWGAMRDGAVAVVIDQATLKVWVSTGEGVRQLDGEPMTCIDEAAAIVTLRRG